LTYHLDKKKRVINSKCILGREATGNFLHSTSYISDPLRAIVKEYQHNKLKYGCLTIFVKGLQQLFRPVSRGENQDDLLNSYVIFILYICNLQVWPQAA
jgi:hypothetical protein